MKRRFPLSLGLVSALMLLQPQNGRGTSVEAPPDASATESTAEEPVEEKLGKKAKALIALFDEEYSPGKPYKQRGKSSWYGKQFHGKKTASGEIFDMHAMTAAHRTLPLQSYVRVTNLANGKEVIVRINDRGPRLHSRIIDISFGAAQALGFSKKGLARVEVEVLPPNEIEKLVKK